MSIIAHPSVDALKQIVAAGKSGGVTLPRRLKNTSQGAWHPGMRDRRQTLRRDSRPVVNDIIAVEFMESARLANPLWVIPFAEIQGLTARR